MAVTPTTPALSQLPDPPLPTDAEATFDAKAGASLTAQVQMVAQINVALTWQATSMAATLDYKNAAGASATQAALAASTASLAKDAAQQAVIDTTSAGANQVTLAKDQVSLAVTAKNETAAIAQAAGVAVGLPIQRVPFTALQVDQAGVVAWKPGIPNMALSTLGQAVIRGTSGNPVWGNPGQVGDLLITAQTITATQEYLPADSVFLKASYPELAAALGLVPRGYTANSRTVTVPNLNNAAYGNGIYVCIGSNGFVSSPDGVTWTNRAFGTGNSWFSVIFAAGIFVAFMNNSAQFATSPDGINWTLRAGVAALNWAVYANGQFVAVGYGTAAATSPDGINWTLRAIPATSGSWVSIAFGAGLYVAGWSNGSSGGIATSPDGITWTTRSLPGNGGVTSMAYGNGRFVAIQNNSSQISVSEDGINWVLLAAIGNVGGSYVAFGGGVFLLVQSDSNVGWMSYDGVTWNRVTFGAVGSWRTPSFGLDKFVVPGMDTKLMNVAPYSYDPLTQFATPKVTVPMNMRAYIKAKVAA
ncbi:hypothetical protein ACTUVN_004467 [Pseudomonas caspiana]